MSFQKNKMQEMKKILVTGSAGFIGSNLVKRLFKDMEEGVIVGIDNLNNYYDPSLKEYRLRELEKAKPEGIKYVFVKGNIADKALIDKLFEEYHFDIVVNLAAQAGVRYSIENPDVYIESNIIGFYNILEACRGVFRLHQQAPRRKDYPDLQLRQLPQGLYLRG